MEHMENTDDTINNVLQSRTSRLNNQSNNDCVSEEVKYTHQVNTREQITRQQIIAIVLFCCASFASTSCFSLIVPFFPEEVLSRGASEWMIGFILSIYQVAAFFSGIYFGKYGNRIGFKFLIVVGNISLGVSTLLFGVLAYSPRGLSFITFCMVIRFFQGLSGSAISTATFAVVAKLFPDRVTFIVGALESSSGLAYTVGPIFGGSTYQIGGFILPFLICGCFQIIIGLLCIKFMESLHANEEEPRSKSYFALLKLPQVWFSISSVMIITISLSFFDLTIAPFLDTFGINALQKGLMLCTISVTYMTMGPIWGHLVDKRGWSRGVMAAGALLNCLGLFFLGPSPILGIKGSLLLVGFALTVMGFGIGAQIIPPFADILGVSKTHGFPDDVTTTSLVSGLVNSCLPLGSLIGPAIGGFVITAIGFPWSTTGLAGLNIIVGLLLLSSILKCQGRVTNEDEEPLITNHLINA